jgi:hypothetical protein
MLREKKKRPDCLRENIKSVSKQAGVMIIHYTRIPEVLPSNLCQDISYSEGFRVFYQYLQANAWVLP